MSPVPTQITLHTQSKELEVLFDTNERFHFSCEYLRVFSPSAEVRGHGMKNIKPVIGKKNVAIIAIEPVGNYGIKPIFDDGHRTGIFSWQTLYELGKNHEKNWQSYIEKTKE